MRYLIGIMIIVLFSCKRGNHYSIDPKAKTLNDSANSIALYGNDYAKAVMLLDQATEIDSNYFAAYRNKLAYLWLTHKLDTNKVLITLKNMNRLRPEDPEYLFQIGLIYLKKGDTSTSTKYLSEAEIHYNKILDTMSVANERYNFLLSYKASNLIFLGREKEGKKIFNDLLSTSKDSVFRQFLVQIINKSKTDILNDFSIEK